MPDLSHLLRQAAERFGIEPGYWDIAGRWHETTDELRRVILESLGLPCGELEALAGYLERQQVEEWSRFGEPVRVISDEESAHLFVHVEDGQVHTDVVADVRFEDGSALRIEFQPAALHTMEEVRVGGRHFLRKQLDLPKGLPHGYHTVQWEVGGSAAGETRLIVSPAKAWMPEALTGGGRRAGLAVTLYGIHSATTWGCGDFTALRGLIDWAATAIGASYIALNPLQAIFNRSPFNTSPYLPNSVCHRNFIYLDVDAIPDVERSASARTARQSAETLAEIAELNRTEFVEYERVAALKARILRLAFERFREEELIPGTERGQAFRRFVEAEGELLERFALYSALDEHLHAQDPDVWIWPQWPAEYQDPGSAAVREFGRTHEREVLFHEYLQWQLDIQAAEAQAYAQARGMEIGLFHDLPLATDRCGFELWSNREFYVAGCRVGAPPDDFSPKGQDWSFPPPNVARHRQDGYRMFAQSIAMGGRHGGALRIDHVMRLFRLYWIPEGFDATKGTYVRDNAGDLLKILALESHRRKIVIVGEDLGTVEPWMREALAQHGILSYRLFYFEKDDHGFKQPWQYPEQALVSSTTHDLPTLAGFWAGRDIEARQALGLFGDDEGYRRALEDRRADKRRMFDALAANALLPAGYPAEAVEGPALSGELHSAITGFLASTPCVLMTLNQEDLTKELDQQNLPGTTWQYPNWRRKMRYSLEDLRSVALAADYARMLDYWLRKTHRRKE